MNNIALIMPYYGMLPACLNYFLRSLCGKRMDVLFFSDLEVAQHPDNFKPIQMTFREFKELAASKLGVPVRLDSPRRLCDFKPMYGKIFEDYLSDYDYWAFGDCDLVYGNKLNEVLDRGLFSKPDILSFERMFCCGPLCLIKNDKRINNLFEMADNWRTIVNLPGSMNVNFDEIGCDKFKEFRSGSITLDDCRRVSDNFSSVVARSKEVKYAYVEAMFQDDLSRGGIVRMGADGALRFNKNGQELAVYHYVRAKLHKYFAVKSMPYHGIRGFRITQTGIYNDGWEWAFHSLIGLRRMFVAGCRSIREKIKNRMVARR